MIDISYYRKMKNIDRLSMMFKNRPYNLLEHSYMVTVLFRRFASIEDVPYDMNVLDIVMNHDAVESVTTDLPWDIKNFSDKTKSAWSEIEKELISVHFQLEKYSDDNIKNSLNKRQHDLFKTCDVLDLLIFVKEEIDIGNNSDYIKKVYSNCLILLENIDSQFPKIKQYIKTL